MVVVAEVKGNPEADIKFVPDSSVTVWLSTVFVPYQAILKAGFGSGSSPTFGNVAEKVTRPSVVTVVAETLKLHAGVKT